MNWRCISYPVTTLMAVESTITLSIHAWRHATWSMPDPGWVAAIYIFVGMAAVIYGAAIGYEAAEKAEARGEEARREQANKEARERDDREKYMEKFGVAPDPDVVAGDAKKKKRESA